VVIIGQGSLDTLLSLSINRGDILVLIAVVGYAGYSIGLRKRPAVHPLSFVTATSSSAICCCCRSMSGSRRPATASTSTPRRSWR